MARILFIFCISSIFGFLQCFEQDTDETISRILIGDSLNSTLVPLSNSSNFNPIDEYIAIFAFVESISPQERDELRQYIREGTYERLKNSIDRRIKERSETNVTDWKNIDEDLDLIFGYHNATVYSAIRSVWLNQLRPFLPLIDQIAIMQYFSQKKAAEMERQTFWTRIWQHFNEWMSGSGATRSAHKSGACWASRPPCIRAAVESLDDRERKEIDRAADENRFGDVARIVREKLVDDRDLEEWLMANRPPTVLDHILEERPVLEEQALQRLRDNGVISSLKHYYKSVIESRSQSDQDDLRRFFDSMNETFARCFDPLRDQFADF